MSESVPKLPVRKTDRKQSTACDACRMRRVKCIRGSLAESCESCIKKQIRCSSDYVTSKDHRPVRGKRIEDARATFGTTNTAGPTRLLIASDTTFISPIAGQLQRHLVQCYFQTYHFQFPIVDQDTFLAAYDPHRHDLSTAPPSVQTLATVLQAWGARVANHVEQEGRDYSSCDPSDPLSAQSLAPDSTLLCTRLFDFALDLFNRHRLATISPDSFSLSAIVLLWWYQLAAHPMEKDVNYLLGAQAIALLRLHMVQREHVTSYVVSGNEEVDQLFLWSALTDIFLCIVHKMPSRVTDDDLARFPAIIFEEDALANVQLPSALPDFDDGHRFIQNGVTFKLSIRARIYGTLIKCGQMLLVFFRKPLQLISIEEFHGCIHGVGKRLILAATFVQDLNVKVQQSAPGTVAWRIRIRDAAIGILRMWNMVTWIMCDFARLNAPSIFPLVDQMAKDAARERFIAFRRTIAIERNIRITVDPRIFLGLTPFPLYFNAGPLVGRLTIEEGGTTPDWTNASKAEELAVVCDSLKTSSLSWVVEPRHIAAWEEFVRDARLRADLAWPLDLYVPPKTPAFCDTPWAVHDMVNAAQQSSNLSWPLATPVPSFVVESDTWDQSFVDEWLQTDTMQRR